MKEKKPLQVITSLNKDLKIYSLLTGKLQEAIY